MVRETRVRCAREVRGGLDSEGEVMRKGSKMKACSGVEVLRVGGESRACFSSEKGRLLQVERW